MKKLFYSAAVALALCGWDARASLPQSGSVRVGPAAEDAAPEPAHAPPPKKDDRKNDKQAGAAKPQESARRPEPAPLSNSTAAASAPKTSDDSKSTSDAPARPGAPTGVPVGAPVRNTSGAEGAPEANKPAQAATAGVPPAGDPNAPAAPTAKPANPPPAVPPTEVYRIGIGDVLDIRLLNGKDPRQNTLYSVVAGGVLDYPLLRDPLTVAGMTTDELAAQLVAEFRHRGLYERPQVRVSVREYASHAVLVSGLVNDPGTKILRREAIPLYVVVAESQPKPEAGRAVIFSRATGKTVTVDLNDPASLNTLVQSGDVVTLTARPPEFFYVGGEIGSPGQKDFHAGLTLTQALLASGGVTKTAGDRVKVSRQGPDGRLVSTEYNLREIENGIAPDPALRPGDRVEVSTAARRK
ncbi:MAG: polysaccharide biosynthesis/export family protein [Acidobacteria bacterium]|nr:polysaccharide biosynthesis/export family protein [Acidobacteriota bacterium]